IGNYELGEEDTLGLVEVGLGEGDQLAGLQGLHEALDQGVLGGFDLFPGLEAELLAASGVVEMRVAAPALRREAWRFDGGCLLRFHGGQDSAAGGVERREPLVVDASRDHEEVEVA